MTDTELSKHTRRSLRKGVSAPVVQAVQAVSDALAASGATGGPLAALQTLAAISTRSDTFTSTTAGVSVGRTSNPVSRFAIQATGLLTQFGVTTWTIVLEGSLDGVTWTTILSHAYPTAADGSTLFSAASSYPALYFRSRCSALVLGTATNVTATVLGLP